MRLQTGQTTQPYQTTLPGLFDPAAPKYARPVVEDDRLAGGHRRLRGGKLHAGPAPGHRPDGRRATGVAVADFRGAAQRLGRGVDEPVHRRRGQPGRQQVLAVPEDDCPGVRHDVKDVALAVGRDPEALSLADREPLVPVVSTQDVSGRVYDRARGGKFGAALADQPGVVAVGDETD